MCLLLLLEGRQVVARELEDEERLAVVYASPYCGSVLHPDTVADEKCVCPHRSPPGAEHPTQRSPRHPSRPTGAGLLKIAPDPAVRCSDRFGLTLSEPIERVPSVGKCHCQAPGAATAHRTEEHPIARDYFGR